MGELNYREAGRYLASLRTKVEGELAMLDIAEATVQSKKQLEEVNSSIATQMEEFERYKGLIGIAIQDAEDAEDASMLRISTASAKVLAKEESAQAEMDTIEDNLKIVRDASSEECERLNAEVANALAKSEERIGAAGQRVQDAETKADQAKQALLEISEMAGGVK